MVESVEFPVSGLWAAARLARERGDTDQLGALVALLEAAVSESVRSDLLEPARGGTPGALLPFRGDALDVLGLSAWLSTHHLGSGRRADAQRRFYSLLSAVEAGYFEMGGPRGGIRHVDRLVRLSGSTRADRHRRARGSRADPGEVLAPEAVTSLLEALRSIEAAPVRVSVPEEGEALLEIGWGKGSLLAPRRKEVPVDFSLVRRDGGGRAVIARRMPGLLLRARSAGVWGLIAPPERVMEVHAAAMAGQGLLIGYGQEQNCFMAAPDFTITGPQGLARCATGALLEPLFGPFSGEADHIRVPVGLAGGLVDRNAWLTPTNLVDLVSLSDPSSQSARSSPANQSS
jgi:hypothetical protein